MLVMVMVAVADAVMPLSVAFTKTVNVPGLAPAVNPTTEPWVVLSSPMGLFIDQEYVIPGGQTSEPHEGVAHMDIEVLTDMLTTAGDTATEVISGILDELIVIAAEALLVTPFSVAFTVRLTTPGLVPAVSVVEEPTAELKLPRLLFKDQA